jgi:hypothetical protein
MLIDAQQSCAGAIAFGLQQPKNSDPHMYINDLWVRPSSDPRVGRRVASHLVNRVIDFSQRQGATHLRVQTMPWNLNFWIHGQQLHARSEQITILPFDHDKITLVVSISVKFALDQCFSFHNTALLRIASTMDGS